MRCLDTAIEMKPDYAQAYFNRGSLHRKLGASLKAEADFQNALVFDAGHFEAHYQLGTMRLGEGRCEEALSSLRKAIEAKPDHEMMYVRVIATLDEVVKKGECLESVPTERERITVEYGHRFQGGKGESL